MEKSQLTTVVREMLRLEGYPIDRRMADVLVDNVFAGILQQLKLGGPVRIRGFGIFSIREGKRTRRDPGDPAKRVSLPSYRRVKFLAGAQLRRALKG